MITWDRATARNSHMRYHLLSVPNITDCWVISLVLAILRFANLELLAEVGCDALSKGRAERCQEGGRTTYHPLSEHRLSEQQQLSIATRVVEA